MSGQFAPGCNPHLLASFTAAPELKIGICRCLSLLKRFNAPGTFFIGFFEFGQRHRGPMISYCPGAP
ncbi:unnamed protein product, partial [Staurois parvus]